MRVGVPDLAATCRAWLETNDLSEKAWALRSLYGGQTHDGEYHRGGFDAQTLGDLLQSIGFTNILIGPDTERDEGICLKAEGTKP